MMLRENSRRSNAVADSSPRKKRGMVLPFEPYSITFDEIVYSVDMPQEMKDQAVMEDGLVLLKGVSGAFRPGVLTALMDVLAGRKTSSGYPKKQETFARISGYCEQNDIHSPQLTLSESLLYSAWRRLPYDSNTKKEVMELEELNPLRNTVVGLPGLSTEQ
ncbi:pleiotropic drug resistance protein 1-like [Trifolium pratense]|uniref:Pleiotropic drug resistance protein 1-like n=1 Tax=Trifolium pratense TaxID=57577 RepID=A0A2K3NTX9_TRIPR|nr:pleiotropic drug resistance protein 1-like [Trifolium pratense]